MDIFLPAMSMSNNFSLWLKASFFFKPIQIHFHLAYLAVKLLNQFLLVLILAPSLIGKKINQTIGGRRLPVPDLARMNLILTGQLRRCLLLPDRLQGNLGLK